MEPLRVLLGDLLNVAGAAWHEKEWHKVAEQLLQGLPPQREFRVGVAASGKFEQACLSMAWKLLSHAAMWDHLSPSALSVAGRSLAFKMVNRLRCCVHEKLASPHKMMPTRMFILLTSPELAAEVAATPPCMQDSWSASFLARYGEDLLSDKAMAVLVTLAELTTKDTAQIEARHASIRRWLKTRSQQTHVMDFEILSCEWTLQRTRLISANRLRKQRDATTQVRAASASRKRTAATPGEKNVAVVALSERTSRRR